MNSMLGEFLGTHNRWVRRGGETVADGRMAA
jgi:hypothetical protein